MEVPKHAHTYTHAQGRESRRDAHLLELLSLSLVFDVTPSAKQPERPPSEGARVEGTGAAQLSPSATDPGQGSTSLPKNPRPSTCWDEPVLHGQGSISRPLLGNQGRAGGCLATLAKAGVPGGGCLASMGRRTGAGLPRPRARRWSAWGGGRWREGRVQHAHGGQGRARLNASTGMGDPASRDGGQTHRDKTVTGWDRVWGFACSG